MPLSMHYVQKLQGILLFLFTIKGYEIQILIENKNNK